MSGSMRGRRGEIPQAAISEMWVVVTAPDARLCLDVMQGRRLRQPEVSVVIT